MDIDFTICLELTYEHARKQADFPFCCVLVGIRDLGFRDDNFNILGR